MEIKAVVNMNMNEKLTQLYSTLMQIETKGESTLIMADCFKFLGQCINECEQAEEEQATE